MKKFPLTNLQAFKLGVICFFLLGFMLGNYWLMVPGVTWIIYKLYLMILQISSRPSSKSHLDTLKNSKKKIS